MRKYYSILLFFWCFVPIQYGFAQTAKKHQVGVSFGFAYNETRDRLVSPLTYTGGQLPIQLYYHYRGINNRHRIRISYSNGSLESSTGNVADDLRGGLQYSYHRYVGNLLNNNIRIFAGLIWDNTFSRREHKFHKLASTEISGELISSINVSFISAYKINNNNSLGLQIFMPVLAYALRPGFSLGPPDGVSNGDFGEIIKSGDVVTINKFMHVGTIISYEKKFFKPVTLRFEYQFIFYQYQNPRKTGTVSNQFGLGIIIIF